MLCKLTYACRHDVATVQGNRPPTGIFSTFHLKKFPPNVELGAYLEFLLSLWDRLRLFVVAARCFNDKANRARVSQLGPERIPTFWVFSFSLFPVYRPDFSSIDKRRDGLFIAKHSCKDRLLLFYIEELTDARHGRVKIRHP